MVYFCEVCGVNRVFWAVDGDMHYQTIGIPNVFIKNICIRKCSVCDASVEVVQGANEMICVVALAVIKKPYRLKIREILFLCRAFRLQAEYFPCLSHRGVLSPTTDLCVSDDRNARSVFLFRVQVVRQSFQGGGQDQLLDGVRDVEPQGFHYMVDATSLNVEYIGTH